MVRRLCMLGYSLVQSVNIVLARGASTFPLEHKIDNWLNLFRRFTVFVCLGYSLVQSVNLVLAQGASTFPLEHRIDSWLNFFWQYAVFVYLAIHWFSRKHGASSEIQSVDFLTRTYGWQLGLCLFKLQSSFYLQSPTSVSHRHGQHSETSYKSVKGTFCGCPTKSDCIYEGELSATLVRRYQTEISPSASSDRRLIKWCERCRDRCTARKSTRLVTVFKFN
jgi:hypothetical protein